MSSDLSGFSMMDLFRMEAEERLSVLSQGLVGLEDSESPASAIEPLMRAAHSLKGAARVVGLDSAVRVAHAMEDCLVAAQKGTVILDGGSIDVLLRGVDLLTRMSQVSEADLEGWQSEHSAEVERLETELGLIQQGEGASGTSLRAAARRRSTTARGFSEERDGVAERRVRILQGSFRAVTQQ